MLVKITQDEARLIIQEYLKKTKIELFGEVFIDTEKDGEVGFYFGTPLESIGTIKK